MTAVSLNPRPVWQQVGIGCAIAFVVALAIWAVLQLVHGDLDSGNKLASIVSMAVAVVSLPLTVISLVLNARQGRQAETMRSPSVRLDAMSDALAVSVRAQWEDEEVIRRVHDPFPMPCRWRNGPEELTDHWQNIHGSPDRFEPIILDDGLEHMADTFHRIPSGRLVVLGRAGAGKTILTSRFVLTVLASRAQGGGEPV